MKRFVLAFFFVLVFTEFINAAAYIRNYRQRGPATHELASSELVGAHPSLPIGTRVTVTNLQNGYTAVVTINSRIAASGSRILDVSEGAAKALGMVGKGAAQISLEVIRDRPDTASGESNSDGVFEEQELEG
jgi:rare lipoprotein A